MMKWLRREIAERAEFNCTVIQAEMLGMDRAIARETVKRLRRETAWSWARIRAEVLKVASRGIS